MVSVVPTSLCSRCHTPTATLRHLSHCDTVPFLPLSPVTISFARYIFFKPGFALLFCHLDERRSFSTVPRLSILRYVLQPTAIYLPQPSKPSADALVDERPRPRAPFNGPHVAKKRAEVGRHGPQSALSC